MSISLRVTWLDSYGAPSWGNRNAPLPGLTCTSVGMLMERLSDRLILMLSEHEDGAAVQHCLHLPVRAIVSIERVTEFEPCSLAALDELLNAGAPEPIRPHLATVAELP
jgi:hypothetical protein